MNFDDLSIPRTCPHPPGRVRLWDGREYCSGCVEAACPGLSAFASAHDALEDAIPFDRSGGLRVWGSIIGLFFLALALVSLGFAVALDLTAMLLLVGTMGLSLGVGAVGSLPSVFRARSVLPKVRVRDGLVEVFRPNHGRGMSPVATYRLEEARWRPGLLQEDSSCRGRGGAIVPRQRVLLLRAPRRWPGVTPPSEDTAVGSSLEMVRIWRGFLEIARIPEGK